MDDSNEQPPETLSLFGSACDASRMFPDFIAPNEARRIVEMCRHDRQLYIRCRDCEIEAFLEESQGLDLLTVTNLGNLNLTLPPFIPIADDFAFKEELDIGGSVIGLQLKDTFKKRERCIKEDALKSNSLFQGKSVIHFSSGRDDLIEPMWSMRKEMRWFETMAKMGLTVTTGINFSVYECMCPFGQHLNIKKSLLSASLMQSAGVPAIPHLYAINENQRIRVSHWLRANPRVQLVSINCQSQKSAHDLQVLKNTIVYLFEHSRYELHIILEGFRISNLDGLYPYLPYLHIAQKQPFMDGLNYTTVDFNPGTERLVYGKTSGLSQRQRGALVVRSIRARREYLEHLRLKHMNEIRVPIAWRLSTIIPVEVSPSHGRR